MLKTAYIHSDLYACYDLGARHPLQQSRLLDICSRLQMENAFCDMLVMHEPRPCSPDVVAKVHTADFIDVLVRASVGDTHLLLSQYGLGPGDTPAFRGMWENGLLYCGGSVNCAELVSTGHYSRAINFAGGLHHAHVDHASGFCILSDIAMAINTLKSSGLKKVLYVDIDVHHGDGVEALFRNDPDVLTVSFHESGAWLFPGTGNVQDRGGRGAEESVWNVPFAPGTGGDIWSETLVQTTTHLLKQFAPDAVVLQAGADALLEDPLGHLVMSRHEWLLTVEKLVQLFGRLPLVILGGGGYNRDAVVDVWSRLSKCCAGLPWDSDIAKITSGSTLDAIAFFRKTQRYLRDVRNMDLAV